MMKFLFERDLSVFNLVCIYFVSWLLTKSLWFFFLVIPFVMISRRMKKRYDTKTILIKFQNVGRSVRMKLPIPTTRKFSDEAAWNHTMANKDRYLLLQAFGYIQHRLMSHPEAGIQGKISLERVQKWIRELS